MLSEQRLSVTFGAFSCDVVGYDDPFSILNRVIELLSEIAKSNPSFGAGEVAMSDMERAKLAAGLSDQASRIEELADQSAPSGVRYVVSNAEADLLNAPRDDATIADTPVEDGSIAEGPVEDDIVIAAEADVDAMSGDLELRDTLEAAGAPALAPEEEVVELEIEPETALQSAVSEDFAAPEQTEDDTSEAVASAEAIASAPVVADEAQTSDPAGDIEDLETVQINAVAEEPMIDAPAPKVQAEASSLAPVVSVEAPAPQRRPLRLNISGAGVAPISDPSPETPKIEALAEDAENHQRRVTVTRLPLRPEPKATPERPLVELKHALTPVHKVEPVVTLNTTISAISDESARPTRAERIKAKMDQRDAEDEGENFLFADVAEAKSDLAPEQAFDRAAEDAPVSPGHPAAAASEPQPFAAAPKPRRSFANLLGFGKKAVAASEPADLEPAADFPAPKAEPASDRTVSANGFDRLRESVAAAMPATDEPLIAYPKEAPAQRSISEAIDYNDETSPTALARRVGATTLQDLLEVSAVYMALVEGKSRFSRRDVMQALHQIDADSDYTQEARLKSFRKLLTTGSLVRVDDGMFTVSQATRYGYEAQLQAS